MPSKRETGNYGEAVAQGFLTRRGYTILETNYKRGGGEIDIIARLGTYVVFAEVKYRRGLKAGLPRESVTPAKQRRIIRTALYYISENDLTETDFRFDVIEVFGREWLDVNHIEDAFQVN